MIFSTETYWNKTHSVFRLECFVEKLISNDNVLMNISFTYMMVGISQMDIASTSIKYTQHGSLHIFPTISDFKWSKWQRRFFFFDFGANRCYRIFIYSSYGHFILSTIHRLQRRDMTLTEIYIPARENKIKFIDKNKVNIIFGLVQVYRKHSIAQRYIRVCVCYHLFFSCHRHCS